MQRAGIVLFDTFFLVLIAGAVATAWRWPFATGLFPLTIGVPVLIVALAQLVNDVLRTRPGITRIEAREQRIRDIQADHSVPVHLVAKRAGSFYGCALAFFALIVLVGFKPAVPIFTALYLKVFSRAGWILTVILAGAMTALVFGVFDRILNVPWPDSLLGSFLGIEE